MKKLFLAATILGAATMPAFSADAVIADPIIEAPVAAIYDWSGFYVGAHVGYGFGNSQHFNFPELGGFTDDFDIDGIIGGASVGYNWQFDSFVAGIEATISASDIDGDTPSSVGFGCGFNDRCVTEVDWYATGEARLGYAFGRILPYIAGGVAVGSLDSYIDGGEIFDPQLGSSSSTEVGYVIGAGLDWGINERLSLNLAYKYFDFGNHEYADATFNGDEFTADVDFSVVQVGIKFRF